MTGLIHEGQCLAFGLEASHDLRESIPALMTFKATWR